MGESERIQRLQAPSAAKVIPPAYGIYGLVDITILMISSFRLAHIGVLGGLCVATAFGLWSRRRWGLSLSLIVTPLTICVGIVTLAASLTINGIAVNAETLALQSFLIIYTVGASMLSTYMIIKRRDLSMTYGVSKDSDREPRRRSIKT